MPEELNITDLYERHMLLGAEMQTFHSWQMPYCYGDMAAEVAKVTATCGLIDRGDRVHYRFYGKGATTALDGRFAMPVSNMAPGQCRYNFLLNLTGGVIDVMLIRHMAENDFLITGNFVPAKHTSNALSAICTKFINLEDLSDALGQIDIIGHKSEDMLKNMGLENLPAPYFCRSQEIAQDLRAIVAHVNNSGCNGFSLLFDIDNTEEVWELLAEEPDTAPCGLGTLNAIRIANAIPWFPTEFNEKTSLLDSGLPDLLKDPKRRFFGRPALEKIIPEYTISATFSDSPISADGELTSISPLPGPNGRYPAICRKKIRN